MASTLSITAAGICTDRTLPSQNPLWTPTFLAASRIFDLDCDTGVTVDANSRLTRWTDSAGGRALALGSGDGALRTYALGARTAPRITLDGYNSDAAIDATVAQRYLWLVLDIIDPGVGTKMLVHTDNLQVYLANSGATLQINGLTGGQYGVPITTGKHIVLMSQQTAGTTGIRIDGAPVATAPRTGVAGVALSTMRLGVYDPGIPDFALGALGLGSGTLDLLSARKLEAYLAHRFGMTALLPADNPWKTKAPRKMDT